MKYDFRAKIVLIYRKLQADDELFDDQDLDACQMKDFVKEALEGVKVSPRRMENDETVSTTA